MRDTRNAVMKGLLCAAFAVLFAACSLGGDVGRAKGGTSGDGRYTVTFHANGGGGNGTEANPFPLAANTMTNGSITSNTGGNAVWYSFTVANGTSYYVWLNDSDAGQGKTLDAYVSAFYSSGTSIFTNVDFAWSSPRSFTANTSGTVKIRVTPLTSGGAGTFAVGYNTTNTMPAASGETGTILIMTVQPGESITIPHESGLSRPGYTFGGWNTSADGTGTTYQPGDTYTPTGNITLYAVWFMVGAGSGTEANPFPLMANTWVNGSIASTTSGNAVWYSFNVVSGTTYYVWWNDADNSLGTLDVRVAAYYSNGNDIFDVDNSDTNTQSFTANSTGTVKIRVYPYSSGTGTFAVAYSTSDTRPGTQSFSYTVSFDINGGSGTALSAQTAGSGSAITLPSGSGLSRTGYTFGGWNTSTDGTGTTYQPGDTYTPTGNVTLYAVWTSTVTYNINSGSGTTPAAQTVNAGSSVTLNNGSGFSRTSYAFGGWNTNADGAGTNYSAGSSYTPTSNITLYAKWIADYTVTFHADIGSGTEVDPFPLTANTMTNGSITSGSAVWYSFNVASGTSYYVWLNDSHEGNGTKTLDAYVSAFYSSGTSIFTNVDSAWSSPRSFTANTSGTVKIRVTSYSSGGAGTFAVGYSANNTRPTASGETGTILIMTVQVGSSVTIPGDNGLSKEYAIFGGWNTAADGAGTNYSAGSSFTPVGDTALYAKWDAVPFGSVTGLANKLAWVQSNAQSNGSYILETSGYESIGPHTLSYGNRSDITVTLRGIGADEAVLLTSDGAMFAVGSGVTLVLDGVNLYGRSNNNNALVRVNSGGTLITGTGSSITGNTTSSNPGGVYVGSNGTFTMNGGKISGNTSSSSYGGGVHVAGGTFTMSGGEISGNTSSSSYGGGVYVGSNGIFNMEDGEISGNTGSGVYMANGTFNMNNGKISGNNTRGVYMAGGTFTMEGGEISGNTGSGVCVTSGTSFTMNGGAISGNTVSSAGGGVYVGSGGNFTMNDGEIFGNTASSYGSNACGGGVYVAGGTFTMHNGEISGNTVSYSSSSSAYSAYGGGVYVDSNGTFRMYNGEISGNTASSSYSNSSYSGYGGGVYVAGSGAFIKTGGTVYGYSAGDTVKSNTVKNSSGNVVNDRGHAAYANGSPVKRKETDAGPEVNLLFNNGASTGGWDN